MKMTDAEFIVTQQKLMVLTIEMERLDLDAFIERIEDARPHAQAKAGATLDALHALAYAGKRTQAALTVALADVRKIDPR